MRASVSRIIFSAAASYSSQLDTPNSANGSGGSGGAAAAGLPFAGLGRCRMKVIWRRKNQLAASRTVFSSSERSCRRKASAASANPSVITARSAARTARRQRAGSASAQERTVATS
jgi:hypothetical protein